MATGVAIFAVILAVILVQIEQRFNTSGSVQVQAGGELDEF